ncbi:hypothetical protein Tco_1432021 [Tanacetum coccineum]
MNNVFQKKEAIQYPRFIKLIVTDLIKKFPDIPKRLEEDYHSIKDDVPLVSVYTTRNVLVRGMLIPDALLTTKIRETDDFKEYETVFMKSPRTPTVSASPQETKKRKQDVGESSSRRITIKRKKQNEEEIDKLVDGDDDDESSASAFADSVLNDDGDDTGSKLEPGSCKEHPEHVSDDDEQKNDEAIEKEKEVVEIVKETNVDDTSAKKHNEVVMEKEVVDMSDKTISDELADTVTPITAISSKTPSTTTRQKKSFTAKTRRVDEI